MAVTLNQGGKLQYIQTGGVSTVAGLSIDTAAASQLDLGQNTLYVNYANGVSPLPAVQSYLISGYDHGAEDGAGIVSSAADTHHGVGYRDNGAAVEVKYTFYGDANLDGTVNLADFGTVKKNFGTTSGATWSEGDFNYDGKVNLGDFGLLKANYGSPTGAIALRSSLAVHSDLAAGQVQLEVNVTTGDAQLDFDNATIGGYEIDSALGELVAANWKTLASQGYSGFSTLGTPTANLLSEGNLNSFLTYNGDIDIGDIFATSTPSAAQDLVFSYLDSNFGQDFVPVVYTGGTSTPEPASLGLIGVAAGRLLRRRRR